MLCYLLYVGHNMMTFEYKVHVPAVTDWRERVEWCLNNVGFRDRAWDITTVLPELYGADYVEYTFKEEADAVFFALKWS